MCGVMIEPRSLCRPVTGCHEVYRRIGPAALRPRFSIRAPGDVLSVGTARRAPLFDKTKLLLRYAWGVTLLDAQPFDAARARRRKIAIAISIAFVLIVATLAWMYRNWPEERVIDHFFAALQKQDYEAAYSLYFADFAWRQHPQKYPQYTYADFYRDWGPGGEWGLIRSYRIYGSADTAGLMSGGVIVEVIVNDRAEHARMFVQRSDKTVTVYPY